MSNPRELLLGDLAKVQPGPVYDSSRKLEESQRAALEAEQISITIYDQLRAQREQLERVSETLHETDANVSHSNRLLNNMIRRLTPYSLFELNDLGLKPTEL